MAKTAVMVIVLLLVAAAAVFVRLADDRAPRPSAATQDLAPPPPELSPEATLTSDPAALAPVSAEEAQRRNAAIAASTEPVQPALPFDTRAGSGEDSARALGCLTAAVYYEAASESPAGQRAVAQVVVNRVRHVAFPHTVCGVVYQGADRSTGCQFTFTCDGSLRRAPSTLGWARARGAAAAILGGYVEREVGLATHYHTTSVLPYWSPKLVKLTTLGAHIFLRWPGDWGQSRAFATPYRGREPAVGDAATLPEDAAAAADGNILSTPDGGTLPTRWDRPLLRPGDAGAGNDAAPAPAPYVERDDRRILGIDQPRPDPSPAGKP